MTTVTIVPHTQDAGERLYRAAAGNRQSAGRTAGEALDGLIAEFGNAEDGTIIVRTLQPDRFFTAEQRQRLADLMARWKETRDSGSSNGSLSPEEEQELQELVLREYEAAGERAEAIRRNII
jgi:hypothetical protein